MKSSSAGLPSKPAKSSYLQWAAPIALLVFAGSWLAGPDAPGPTMRVPSTDVMRIWADHNWDIGTTSLPISRVSVLAKQILSKQFDQLPNCLHEQSDTISIGSILRFINEDRHAKLLQLCPTSSECDVLTPDPVYHMTPLHLANFSGDKKSVEHLLNLGADPDALDKFHRKPANLTFNSFIENSKKFATLRGSSCELPEVFLDPEDPSFALSEIHRLVSEGEPVVIRNLVQFMNQSDSLEWNSARFLQQFGDVNVTVGSVPYASYFGLASVSTNIQEYMSKADEEVYVFNKNEEICANAFKLLDKFVQMAFPVFFTSPHTLGHESIHFFLGQKGSGAPFHLHSDAVNLLTHGKKSWFITPPLHSVYSRIPIHDYLKSDAQIPSLQCEQNAGDAMYIPFDWGHAVFNTENETFGFAVELLNDRDSFRFLRASH